MSDKKTSSGFGLGTVLTLIFLTLKLGGWGVVATWSWWWVFSPIWIPILLIVVILFFLFLMGYFLK
jgi:hypothetical protein